MAADIDREYQGGDNVVVWNNNTKVSFLNQLSPVLGLGLGACSFSYPSIFLHRALVHPISSSPDTADDNYDTAILLTHIHRR